MMTQRDHSAGFTLIEVLVATFLVGFGLISMLQLDVYGMRKNKEVDQTSTAMIFALEFSERIRSNISAGPSYEFSFNSDNQPSEPEINCFDSEVSAANVCSQMDLVLNEKYDFWQRLQSQIPESSAQVLYDATTGQYEFTISWPESASGTEGTATITRRVKAIL